MKEKKNIDKLYKYIVHKCYGYPFSYPAAIVDRDAIFIPSGWDNPKKADILLENLHRLKANSNYSDVFVKPVLRRVNLFSVPYGLMILHGNLEFDLAFAT